MRALHCHLHRWGYINNQDRLTYHPAGLMSPLQCRTSQEQIRAIERRSKIHSWGSFFTIGALTSPKQTPDDDEAVLDVQSKCKSGGFKENNETDYRNTRDCACPSLLVPDYLLFAVYVETSTLMPPTAYAIGLGRSRETCFFTGYVKKTVDNSYFHC